MTNSDTGTSNQKDKVFRYSLNWQSRGEKTKWNITSGFINDNIHYVDSKIEIAESNIRSYSFINEVENKIQLLKNHLLNSGLNYTREIGQSDGLSSNVDRNRVSIFSTYQFHEFKNKLNVAFSFRSEYIDDKFIPTVYSIGTDYDFLFCKIKGNISKNYRLPTFNDLYWKAGKYTSGNPNLKPESGISGNVGLDKTIVNENFSLQISEIFFYSHLNDWIVWLPNTQGVWMPENQKEGINKGFESELSSKLTIHQFKFGLNFNYSYTKSESIEYVDNEKIVKQSIYVPNHKLTLTVFYSFKKLELMYVHNYFGQRFYDNVHLLESYQIGEVNLGFNKKINKNDLKFSLKISNIWSVNYQVIAWYAMPLRNYQFSITYKFNK
ncbi:MAG: hypothetical protein A2265_04535 [Bacteroidetes bacterium RIFOXYA12_FULL_33_9]|nr:MAG: hypothetical protein A2265_04535 [Bacteroidetes bacterium RIFOXYA12_FULL_33_9]